MKKLVTPPNSKYLQILHLTLNFCNEVKAYRVQQRAQLKQREECNWPENNSLTGIKPRFLKIPPFLFKWEKKLKNNLKDPKKSIGQTVL